MECHIEEKKITADQNAFIISLPVPKKHISTNIGNTDMETKDEVKIPKNNRKDVYGKGQEAKAIKEQLGDFNANDSMAYKLILNRFGRSIRFSELLAILNTIQIYIQIKNNTPLPLITRNEKRSFPLLIKYIERNNHLIMPYIQYISLCDSSFHKIQLDTND